MITFRDKIVFECKRAGYVYAFMTRLEQHPDIIHIPYFTSDCSNAIVIVELVEGPLLYLP